MDDRGRAGRRSKEPLLARIAAKEVGLGFSRLGHRVWRSARKRSAGPSFSVARVPIGRDNYGFATFITLPVDPALGLFVQ